MRILVFGDSNTSNYIEAALMADGDDCEFDHITVERHDGLALRDNSFPFLFTRALHHHVAYDAVVLSIGTNDLGRAPLICDETVDALCADYAKLKRCFRNEFGGKCRLLIVGPHAADIDTQSMATFDGVPFSTERWSDLGRQTLLLLATTAAHGTGSPSIDNSR